MCLHWENLVGLSLLFGCCLLVLLWCVLLTSSRSAFGFGVWYTLVSPVLWLCWLVCCFCSLREKDLVLFDHR